MRSCMRAELHAHCVLIGGDVTVANDPNQLGLLSLRPCVIGEHVSVSVHIDSNLLGFRPSDLQIAVRRKFYELS